MQETVGHTVEWGKWIGEGWQMFVDDWKGWVIKMLAVVLIILIPLIPIYAVIFAAQVVAEGSEKPELPSFAFILLPFLVLLIILASAFVYAGAFRAAFRQLRGQHTTVGEMFSGGDTVLRVIGVVLLISVFAVLGAVFCILPAYVVLGTLHYAVPLVVERDSGITEALRTSWDATKGHWLQFTLFGVVVHLIGQLGSAACGIGILFTLPLFFTITVVAYRDIFGVTGARSFMKNVPVDARPPAASSGATCPHCGSAVVSATARFCNVCGRELIR